MKSVSLKTIFITALILLPALTGCAKAPNGTYSKSGMYFDTIVSIDIFGPEEDPEALLDECMDLCAYYEQLFDKNIPTSDIAKINSAPAGTYDVDHDTAMLINKALQYSELTNGRFDITIAPVSALWDFHDGACLVPKDDDIKKALKNVNRHNIEADIENDTVTVLDPDVSIDAGAAAKGYIADSIASFLEDRKISGAIINMGGDIRLIGKKSDDKDFLIGINDPSDPGAVALSLYLSDISVATSGIYERAFTVDGKRYHHILDVKTGYPVVTDVESVTVITGSATDADCLCTAAILEGSDEGLKLIESTDGTEAVFILTDGTMKKSSGADAYIRQ